MTAAEIYAIAYRLAQAADDAWEAELRSVYGDYASGARYSYLAYTATPFLKALYEAKRKADDNLHDAALLRLEASRAAPDELPCTDMSCQRHHDIRLCGPILAGYHTDG